jgi:hypothetical protein
MKMKSFDDLTTQQIQNLKPACEVFKFPKFKKASEVLEAARKVIRSEKRWATGELAFTAEFDEDDMNIVPCKTRAKQAMAFCALGAVQFVDGPAERSATAFLREAGKHIIYGEDRSDIVAEDHHIFKVNDEMGHKPALKMFSLAIRAAKKAEAAKSK